MSEGAVDWIFVFRQPHIVEIIFSHLPPGWIQALMVAIPSTLPFLRPSRINFRKYVLRALLNSGLERGVALRIMDQCDCGEWALTGSALLCAIYDEFWPDVGDVDLIVPRSNCPLLGVLWEYELLPVGGVRRIRAAHPDSKLEWVTDLLIGPDQDHAAVVQGLFLKSDGPRAVDDYVKTYDLEFCRCYYTGGRLVMQHPESVAKKANAADLDICKYTFPRHLETPMYVLHAYLPARYLRYCRYLARGFSFTLRHYTHVHRETPTVSDELDARPTDPYTNGLIAGMWHLFWRDRIDAQGRLIVTRPPAWKRLGAIKRRRIE